MTTEVSDPTYSDLRLLKHHIYEYQKGVRNMVLHTMSAIGRIAAEDILARRGICFYTDIVSENKINIFFGNKECIDVIRSFGGKKLGSLSPEEDFIVGVLLGYNPCTQCERFIKRKGADRNQCCCMKA